MIVDKKECFFCGTTENLQVHHIFFGPNRNNSEKYGMTVYLCQHHHTGDIWGSKESVHHNRRMDMILKQTAEHKWLDEGHTEDEFRSIFGKWW